MNTLLDFILNDTSEVLSKLGTVLDSITTDMASDKIVQDSMQDWRDLFSKWRNGFSHQAQTVEYIVNLLQSEAAKIDVTEEEAAPSSRVMPKNKTPMYMTEFLVLKQEIKHIMKRGETIFSALMATMSIIESHRAIAEAVTVTKLTNLAFFFLPLTLTAAIFGSDIVVCRVTWVLYQRSCTDTR
jgi:Mg2+ and Co2+ transporter CorA